MLSGQLDRSLPTIPEAIVQLQRQLDPPGQGASRAQVARVSETDLWVQAIKGG